MRALFTPLCALQLAFAPVAFADSGTGAIVGGVTGAILGNQLANGRDRGAATLFGGMAGAALGAAIGNDDGRPVRYSTRGARAYRSTYGSPRTYSRVGYPPRWPFSPPGLWGPRYRYDFGFEQRPMRRPAQSTMPIVTYRGAPPVLEPEASSGGYARGFSRTEIFGTPYGYPAR